MRGPGIGCWFSDRSNCSCRSFEAAVLPINPNIDTDQWEPFIIYHFIILQTHYQFKLDFQKVDLHTGGTWLNHGTRNRKDNQLQSMELPCRISWWNRNLQNWFLRNIFFSPSSRVIGENSLNNNSHCHMADAKRGNIFKCRLWENYTTFCHDVSEWFL